MPCGKKRKRHKIATHKRKKRLRKNRHKKKQMTLSTKADTVFKQILLFMTVSAFGIEKRLWQNVANTF